MSTILELIDTTKPLVVREWRNHATREQQIIEHPVKAACQADLKEEFIRIVNGIRRRKGSAWDFLHDGKNTQYEAFFGNIEWPIVR